MNRIAAYRVALAGEVLRLLGTQEITATDSGAYRHTDRKTGDVFVCALGALLVAACPEWQDELPDDSVTQEVIHTKLAGYFPWRMLGLLETAYEGSGHYATKQGASPEEVAAALALGFRYSDPEARMTAIMNNITDNNGEFLP